MGENILIIDDSVTMLKSMRELFADYDYCVDIASCKDEVFELISQKCYAVVFLDLALDEMNGLDLVPMLLESSPNCKIVTITGFSSVDLVLESWRKGCFDYIEKPFEPSEIIDVLKRALKKSASN